MEDKDKTTTPEMPDIDVLFELADLFKVLAIQPTSDYVHHFGKRIVGAQHC